MAVLEFDVRRFILISGSFVAAVLVPAMAAVTGPHSTAVIPLATCAPGELEEPLTLACTPAPVPGGVVVAPGLSEPWRDQDVYDTPGEEPGQAGGTTVP